MRQRPSAGVRAFRVATAALGVVPAATGLASLSRGTSIIRGAGPVSPSVESEHRFFAAWWTALGPYLWSLAPQAERRRAEVRAVAATVFVGGLARLRAARDVGRPHPVYQVLTGIELVLPLVLVAWQQAVSAADPTSEGPDLR